MVTFPIVEELHELRARRMEAVGLDFAAFFRRLKEEERGLEARPVPPPNEPPPGSMRPMPHPTRE